MVEINHRGDAVRQGLSEPFAIGRVLSDMNEQTYARRDAILYGLRYLAPMTHFVSRAQAWKDGAFAKLDIATWPSIAG